MRAMQSLKQLRPKDLRVLLTDIDGTLTLSGRLPESSYGKLSDLSRAGIYVIPVTGRPAGWCEMIARLWPVHGVVGENGAFTFRYDGKKMKRHFARTPEQRKTDREKLKVIRREVLSKVPGAGIASDQFSRMFDLAIDFSEDVKPLSEKAIQDIVKIFKKHGAQAKVSNIHVNGWFGAHDKVTTCKEYLEKEFGYSEADMRKYCAFVGDSPNDEPMFEFFPNSVAVANIAEFLPSLKHKPAFVTPSSEAEGFCELATQILSVR